MITVHLDTIESKPASYTYKGKTRAYEAETIEITIRGDRRRVRCHAGETNISIYGLAVRFRTGTKVWPGSATYWHKTGNVNNLRPNIDKFSGQFCQLVGFFDDYESSRHRSQHNAVA